MFARNAPVGRILSLAPYLAAIVLALPVLNAPFFDDDVYHRTMLIQRDTDPHWGPLTLYEFVGDAAHPTARMRERGLVPWFSADDLRIRFFRPLSSASVSLDYYLFGARPWAARLVSLAWFLAALALTRVVLGAVLSARAAWCGTLLYSLAAGHAMTVSWIAARHGLVSTVMALMCIRVHLAWRVRGWQPGRWLGPLLFAAALTSGEMAMGTVAIVGAWELFGPDERRPARRAALVPYVAIAMGYLALYVALDYGPREGAYLSPADPAAAVLAFRRFGVLLADLVLGIPADVATVASVARQWTLAAIGVTSALSGVVVLRAARDAMDPRDRSAVSWLAVAGAGSAAPGAFAVLGGRVLTLALVPASGVLAIALLGTAAAMRDPTRRSAARAAFAAVAGVLVLTHVVGAAALRMLLAGTMRRIAYVQHEETARVAGCTGTLVIVAASDPTIGMFVPATRQLQGVAAERSVVLSMSASDQRIENVTGSGFDLVASGNPKQRTAWEMLFRRRQLNAGTAAAGPSFRATVLEDHMGIPTRTRFEFDRPLGSGFCFVTWHAGHLTALPPLTSGTRLDLPHDPGPVGQ